MSIERRLTYCRWAFSVCLAVVLALSLMPQPTPVPPTVWDKTDHAMAFAVLAMLGCWSYPERKPAVLLGLLAYGGLIELLQGLAGYRIADMVDVLADAVGVLFGWQFARLSRHIRALR